MRRGGKRRYLSRIAGHYKPPDLSLRTPKPALRSFEKDRVVVVLLGPASVERQEDAPAWLPMKASCSGVAARARRRVAAPSPAPGGATSIHLLVVSISKPPC